VSAGRRPTTGEGEALLGTAQKALAAGQWSTARASFEAVLEREESAEALFGLGNALWWLGETEASVRCQERAYAVFRRRPDPAQAALTAIYLCLTYRASLGNYAASRGWLGRAARLVKESDLAALGGWVLLCRAVAANDGADPVTAEVWARKALEAARDSSDGDLELCALSELGAALVEMGKLDEGAALLDEAMAGSLGGETDTLDTVVLTSCNTVVCCSRAGDFNRAVQWIRAADDFNRRYGSPHLYTVCRTHYGGILFATGRWVEAERELRAALEIGRAAEPALHAEALAKLAELRLAQGRTDEAARLLSGFEDLPAAVYAVGALRLATGVAAATASIVRRRLEEVGEASLEGTALLELLVEAEIERGDFRVATATAQRLAKLGSTADSDLIGARRERALGRVLLATAQVEAIAHLERALATFIRLDIPFEGARTRVLLARALASREREAAIAEARRALAVFEALGAEREADTAAAFLRALGVKVARRGSRGVKGALTKRERQVLTLLGEGLSNPEIAERLLISRKTVEHHVASVLSKLDLSSRGEATAYAVRHQERIPPRNR
jgi:ATP/maltotriose-dependent transcriptional regulator MalT